MSYNSSNYQQQGGDRWVVGGDLDVVSGGEIDIQTGARINIETGGTLEFNGTDKTAALAAATATPVAGVAAGYKLARGEAAVTGSSDIATGLATVVAVTVSLEAVGVGAGDAYLVTAKQHATPGTITVECWEDDGSAAENAGQVHWIAVGT